MSAAMIPGLVLAAAGTGAQMYTAGQQRRQQQDAINKMMGIDAPMAAQENNLAIERAKAFTPQNTVSATDAAAAEEASKLGEAIKNATTAMPAVSTPTGRVSPTYATAQTDWTKKGAENEAALNAMYARMFAPSQMALTRGLSDAELAQQASTIASKRAGNYQAGQLTAGGILPNQWMQFGGNFAQGAGTAWASNAYQQQANADFMKAYMNSGKTTVPAGNQG